MKTMTCRQLGGACEEAFTAGTFREIAALSQAHGARMFQLRDGPHLAAMDRMRLLMVDPDALGAWMAQKEREFDLLTDDRVL